jgi:hypothetical protein
MRNPSLLYEALLEPHLRKMAARRLVFGIFSSWITTAWWLMLMVGNAHRWWHQMPLMGFGTALAIMLPGILIGVTIAALGARLADFMR